MSEHNGKQILGKKDVTVTLLPGKSSSIAQESCPSSQDFKQFSSEFLTSHDHNPAHAASENSTLKQSGTSASPNYFNHDKHVETILLK